MLKIGDKIKQLRKQQHITQEKLAAYLNISYQAVSKWENGTALPDVTLVPQIANFFGVTADELLGMKEQEKTEELKIYEARYHENNRLGKMMDNILLSREVLARYPRNYQWMLNLAYPLTQYEDTDEHRQYSAEHGFREEAIGICERILEDCTTDSIRHSAIQLLCYHYPQVGKKEEALKLADEMPSMPVSRDFLLEQIYQGEERIKQGQNNLMQMVDMSAGCICWLVSLMGKELTNAQKIELIGTANELFRLILKDDEDSLFFNCRLCRNYGRLAELWCQLGDTTKAMENLLLAEKTAVSYDDGLETGEQAYRSLLANRCTFNPKTVGKNWEGTERDLLLRNMAKPVFDSMRAMDAFCALQNRLQ